MTSLSANLRLHCEKHARALGSLVAIGGLLLGTAACKESKTDDRKRQDPVVVNEGECAPTNATATCTCADKDNAPGRQVCMGGKWAACECVKPDDSSAGGAGSGGGPGSVNEPAGNSSAKRFTWKRTPFELGSCKAGHYVGNFSGTYTNFPVVSTPGLDGAPGLEFWLNKMEGSGEVFSISGGKIRGTADGLVPFTIDLTGTLDCKTKKFDGVLTNGQYDLFGTKHEFEGTMIADYDKVQNKFVAGTWTTVEPSNPSSTGMGMWDAAWQAM